MAMSGDGFGIRLAGEGDYAALGPVFSSQREALLQGLLDTDGLSTVPAARSSSAQCCAALPTPCALPCVSHNQGDHHVFPSDRLCRLSEPPCLGNGPSPDTVGLCSDAPGRNGNRPACSACGCAISLHAAWTGDCGNGRPFAAGPPTVMHVLKRRVALPRGIRWVVGGVAALIVIVPVADWLASTPAPQRRAWSRPSCRGPAPCGNAATPATQRPCSA